MKTARRVARSRQGATAEGPSGMHAIYVGEPDLKSFWIFTLRWWICLMFIGAAIFASIQHG
jgi:hypothetical protein